MVKSEAMKKIDLMSYYLCVAPISKLLGGGVLSQAELIIFCISFIIGATKY